MHFTNNNAEREAGVRARQTETFTNRDRYKQRQIQTEAYTNRDKYKQRQIQIIRARIDGICQELTEQTNKQAYS